MKRHIFVHGMAGAIVASIVMLPALCNCAEAVLVFNDGGEHIINYEVSEPVYVDEASPGVGTKVKLLDGGLIQAWIHAYEDSRVNILGGRVSSMVRTYDRSHVTMVGGEISGPFFGWDTAVIDISGGKLGAWFQTFNNVQATISGGHISSFVEAWDYSRVTISGGTIGGRIAAIRDSLITLVGTNFAINGRPVACGDFASAYGTMGVITGTLANGDALNNNYSLVHPGADIRFIPEPATLLLVLGGIVGTRLGRRNSVGP
jgi:hypothetical protein